MDGSAANDNSAPAEISAKAEDSNGTSENNSKDANPNLEEQIATQSEDDVQTGTNAERKDAGTLVLDEDIPVTISSGATVYYYKFVPTESGTYYFKNIYANISGYCENETVTVSDSKVDLVGEKIYYFCFNALDEYDYMGDETVKLVKASQIEDATITVTGDPCILAEKQTFTEDSLTINYTLKYANGKTKTGEYISGRYEDNNSDHLIHYVDGLYNDTYDVKLINQESNACVNFSNLSIGTYKLGICNTDGSVLATAEDYTITVKSLAELSVTEATLESGIESVDVTDPYGNSYKYYKFIASQDGRYFITSQQSSDCYLYTENGWVYMSRKILGVEKGKAYYFVFTQYDDEIKSDKIEFIANKSITACDVAKGKTTYTALVDTILNDWKLTLTYEDESTKTYLLNQLLGNKYDPAYDDYGNEIYCTLSKEKENYYSGATGKYEVNVGTDWDNRESQGYITVNMPTKKDWSDRDRQLKLGANKVSILETVDPEDKDIGYLEETYYLFVPEKDGTYVFSDDGKYEWADESYGTVNDGIWVYNDGEFEWSEDVEIDDEKKQITLTAKAGTEYYYYVTPYGSTRTINISQVGGHTHAYTSAVTKAPTCSTPGVRTYTCKDGDHSYTETIPVDKNNHASIATLPAKAATCTATGLTEGKKCTACGTVTVPQQTTPALGHVMGNWVTTQAPTALADGVQTRTCSRCGYAETAAIARLAATGSLNATNVPLKVKQSATLTVKDMAAGDYVASWTSSDTKIVTVNNGKITGKKKGTAKVTATLASGRVLTVTVKVQTGNVKTTGITVNSRKIALVQGDVFQLVSSITPFTSKDKLSYKTSNKKVATVSKNGKITAKKAGKATITVKAGKKSVKVTVYVSGVKTTDLSVNTTQLNLKVKKKATIKAYVTPKNTSETVTYKTSNKKVATVDKKGKVTARKAGTATITVTSGSKSVKVNVTVTK